MNGSADSQALAREFEAERPRLQALAPRLLGSRQDADEAVQEAWLRLSRTDAEAIDNLGGWLTTVVGRICLDVLRARTARPSVVSEEPLDPATVPAGPRSRPASSPAARAAVCSRTLRSPTPTPRPSARSSAPPSWRPRSAGSTP